VVGYERICLLVLALSTTPLDFFGSSWFKHVLPNVTRRIRVLSRTDLVALFLQLSKPTQAFATTDLLVGKITTVNPPTNSVG
jgi:hypothetical protein